MLDFIANFIFITIVSYLWYTGTFVFRGGTVASVQLFFSRLNTLWLNSFSTLSDIGTQVKAQIVPYSNTLVSGEDCLLSLLGRANNLMPHLY